ncbi:Cof-type HAD-IIB family hydrolase [Lactobacillus sp. PV012]|uniref:Cof-type HAD-IIB family hydrolase n=1 Tax=Lactobacillus sp. PV012 TaxID=2594494 RepID=UPI0022404F3C|nr:Cof-type HAD-IIB family hydrolase [Lactobacillus sp. PV012]QNQ82526.1 HAD family phosphatase [Lactobacillus sp. PV012]
MAIKLIAVDLDGTLLTSDHKISEATKKALQKAAKMGISIVPCSGRPFPGVKEYLEELELQGDKQYAITFNGALVFDMEGKEIVKDILNFADFTYFLELAKKYKMPFHVELEDYFVTLDKIINIYLSQESWLTKMPIKVEDFEKIPEDFTFVKGMYTGSSKRIEEFLKEINWEDFKDYNASTSDPSLFELNSKTASKGNALKKLAKKIGIKEDEVMIFGDQSNDLSMFSVPAFKKVAMGNAIEEIKEKADFVTRTNNHNGIAYALERLVF